MYERNSVETIVDNDGYLWLNKKHIEEWLGHKYLWKVTTNITQIIKRHRYELLDEPKKQSSKEP